MKTRAGSLLVGSLALALSAIGCGAPTAQVVAPDGGASKEVAAAAPPESYVEVVELPIEAAGDTVNERKVVEQGGGSQNKKKTSTIVDLKDDEEDGKGEGAPPDDAAFSPAPGAPQSAATSDAVAGRVDAAQIRAAVARNMSGFAACLEVDSVVEIDATISAQGEVIQAKANRSQPDNPKTRDCVGLAFTRIRLEPLSPPAPAHVRLALSLRKPSSY